MNHTAPKNGRPSKKATRQIKLHETAEDPARLARCYIDKQCKTELGKRTLVWWRNEWWAWDGKAYRLQSVSDLRCDLTRIIKSEFDRLNILEQQKPRKKGAKIPYCRKVTLPLLGNVMNALQSICSTSASEQPSWLGNGKRFPATEYFATQSGLIHIPSLRATKPKLLEATPLYFSTAVVNYDFDPHAECPNWLAFLVSIWGKDFEIINCLQEWFGYLLLPDISQQKMLILIGPPRSGKGTIAKILAELIGVRSICTPKLSSLGRQFGLWPLVGKSVGIFADARIGRSYDHIAVLESLLSITGGDLQDVDRKMMPPLTGIRLPIRFVLMTNELPNLPDASAAFSSRVVMLPMTESFVGKEDTQLASRLLSELPGIFNWAIRGWQRLQSRGWFLQPDAGREVLSDLQDLTSPISHFVREMCVVGPEFIVVIDDLFNAFKEWYKAEHGEECPAKKGGFCKDLLAKFGKLKRSQPRMPGDLRPRCYTGIGLRSGTGWHACQSIAHDTTELSDEKQENRDSLERVPRVPETNRGESCHEPRNKRN